MNVNDVRRRDQRCFAKIGLFRKERVERRQPRVRWIAIAAGEIRFEADPRSKRSRLDCVSRIRCYGPGADISAAKRACLNECLVVIIPSTRLSPKTRAERVAQLICYALLEHRVIALQ